MGRRHSIVLKKPDGSLGIYPMRQWLRDNPQHLPEGMSADIDTSHELRRALKNSGWKLDERFDKVLLIKPSDEGDTSFADELDELLDSHSEIEESYYEEGVAKAKEVTFRLERDLQSALRDNIEQLEPGLRIIDEGKERATDAGRIDITAMDTGENIVVVELKTGTASPEAIAQVLAYMGAVVETDNKPVRGILVAGDFHKRVVLAARAVPNLRLEKYSFQFTFKPVE